MIKKYGANVGDTFYRRSLRRGTAFVAVTAAIVVSVQGNVGLAYGEELGDEPLSWTEALDRVEPAEAYDPIPDDLEDFPWTWQERATQAADLIRHTYPNDFSWFEFAQEGPGVRIGFVDEVPEGAAEIVNSLRAHVEDIKIFDEQQLDEQELVAANLYLSAAVQEESAAATNVALKLGDSPVLKVTGDTSEAAAVGKTLAEQVAVIAEEVGDLSLKELPVEFEAPIDHEPTDPIYDGMVLGPQAYGRAGGNAISGSGGTCTAGVVVRSTTSADLGALTASHCSNSSLRWHNSSGPTLSFRNETQPPYDDIQFNQSSVLADAWFHHDTGAGRPVLDASIPYLWERICVFGVGSNAKRCGVVTELSRTTDYPNSASDFVGAYVRFDYGTYTNPGDSGGTVYGEGGNTIRGIYSGLGGVVSAGGAQYAQGFFARIDTAQSRTGTRVCLDPVPRGC